jgi:nicotinate-nucleotide pyrophosphorylase (carboxylating)
LNKPQLSPEQIDRIIDAALKEDLSHGDITSETLLPPQLYGKASVLVKAKGVLAGIEVAKRVFLKVDPSLKVEILLPDGSRIKPADIAATISGKVTGTLKAERTALNFLQRLSGIASLTAQYIEAIKGSQAVITDTRKTTPGLRMLEKYAVRMGGGQNHRFHLGDALLIKDNHLVALRSQGESLQEIVARAKQKAPRGIKVEVEVGNFQEAMEAVEGGADIIMLDNMSLEEMRRVVAAVSGKSKLEASGGITLDNVRDVALTGVDIISIGALTHSPRALDISLELEPESLKLL